MVQSCAVDAAAAAGSAAIATDLTGVAPAFWASFDACMAHSTEQVTAEPESQRRSMRRMVNASRRLRESDSSFCARWLLG